MAISMQRDGDTYTILRDGEVDGTITRTGEKYRWSNRLAGKINNSHTSGVANSLYTACIQLGYRYRNAS